MEELPSAALLEKAALFVSAHPGELSPELHARLYGYYKQATVGDCNEPCPPCHQTQERNKWSVWNCLAGKSREAATLSYLKILDNIIPDWQDPNRVEPCCSSSLK